MRTKLLEPMSFALLVGLYGGAQGSLDVRTAATSKGNDMNALMAAGQSNILSIKQIGELMGDPEQSSGSPGGLFADQLLQCAREGKLRTVTHGHVAYGCSALVHVSELAACMAATGIGQKTPAAGWVRLKGTRKPAEKITDEARRHIAAQAQLGVTVTNIQAVQFVAGSDA